MSELSFQSELDDSDPQIRKALSEANDFWDVYYHDDERYRSIHNPDEIIVTRLEQRYTSLRPETITALGELARAQVTSNFGR